ncbi:hypothetical protein PTKIN_Ptkin03bG0216900 [Pterospermum kingtungense]
MIMILLAGQATVKNVEAKADRADDLTLPDLINELISQTQRAKAKVATLEDIKMVHDCNKAYDLALEFLNKVVDIMKIPGPPNIKELETNIKGAVKAYESCGYKYTESTTSKQANNN